MAVVHPARRVIAHLLWRDDVHGARVPGMGPTDQKVIWVGYAARAGRQVLVDVQWGKHGLLQHAGREHALPRGRTPNVFYAFAFAFPDLAPGRRPAASPAGATPRSRRGAWT